MREETCCCHMGYSFWLAARGLLYTPPHRQDNTYHNLCYTSHGALAGTKNSSMGPHEGSIRRPITPWTNAVITELHLAPGWHKALTSIQLITCAIFWIDEYVRDIHPVKSFAELSTALHQKWQAIPQRQIQCLVQGKRRCFEAVIRFIGGYTR